MNPNNKSKIIFILGVGLDKENFPVLYDWAKSNPTTLATQLQSIADKWHEGDLNMAAICLESDLK
ncbi:MAG: hypothetical protein NTY61_04030 [Candidatus Parcubacteria bacterium]|nr:hypothetical protein [Candidatus Parcubacteria bacterium]